jgi:hypothetical protein
MIGAALCLAVKVFFMGAAMSLVDLPMEAQVSPVIPVVLAVVVVVASAAVRGAATTRTAVATNILLRVMTDLRCKHLPRGNPGWTYRSNRNGDPLNVIATKRLSVVHAAAGEPQPPQSAQEFS